MSKSRQVNFLLFRRINVINNKKWECGCELNLGSGLGRFDYCSLGSIAL